MGPMQFRYVSNPGLVSGALAVIEWVPIVFSSPVVAALAAVFRPFSSLPSQQHPRTCQGVACHICHVVVRRGNESSGVDP
ncbi:hypothetical protein F4802DRAFT_544083 [Xylaria palmicola]|nr:hypothetical protein F4802DRAFT_544083 [Xylaria palmicola]